MTKDKKRIKEIQKMRANRYKLREIAKHYGVTPGRIWQIMKAEQNLTK